MKVFAPYAKFILTLKIPFFTGSVKFHIHSVFWRVVAVRALAIRIECNCPLLFIVTLKPLITYINNAY